MHSFDSIMSSIWLRFNRIITFDSYKKQIIWSLPEKWREEIQTILQLEPNVDRLKVEMRTCYEWRHSRISFKRIWSNCDSTNNKKLYKIIDRKLSYSMHCRNCELTFSLELNLRTASTLNFTRVELNWDLKHRERKKRKREV
jgi:hypothetical protein